MRRRDGEIEFDAPQFRGRARLLTGVLALIALVLLGRSLELQVFDRQFITKQADMRHARVATMLAHRGAILVRSQPGHGTSMRVLFPLERADDTALEGVAPTRPRR